jgi:uncharacterized protein
MTWLINSWEVFSAMAPYLIFGFIVAGLLSVWIVPSWIEKHLGGGGIWPIIKASLLGIPLPLCSCSVIPVSMSLWRHGASKGSTLSFMLSTPQTGVDSVLVTYSLLGPVIAILRPCVAFMTGVLGGIFASFSHDNTKITTPQCTMCAHGGHQGKNIFLNILKIAKDIAMPLLFGVFIAGGMTTLVPAGALTEYLGGGILSILAMILVSVPVYVCATASVPIAAGFIYMGISPGAALAFLVAGPATNAVTCVAVWKNLGWHSTLSYLGAIMISAISSGILLDWFLPAINVEASHVMEHVHQTDPWYFTASAVIVIILFILSYFWKTDATSNGHK